ncbi:MAG: hypothetical protein A2029_17255 [Chloroflexi bacterium RBG_19FT_COMBO_47_9]|nr:MAG: hypothetical protein A2029_17255 [Chloroflexi bacterium RBG_19FT_COMBO_47_9]
MLRKPARGAKVKANTVTIMISALCAMDREVFWSLNHPTNAHIVQARVFWCRVNIKTGVRSAEDQAGRMSIKTHLLLDKCRHAFRKQSGIDYRRDIRDW